MKFEEAIKIAGKEYIKEVMQQETQEEKLSIKFRINMWWMFRKYSFLNKNGTKGNICYDNLIIVKRGKKACPIGDVLFLYHFLKEGWLCEFIRSGRKNKKNRA